MKVILLEPINNDQIGSIITVKSGYARNFLIPQGKAVRATADNQKKFEKEKESYIAKLNNKLEIIKVIHEIIHNKEFVIKAKASSNMRLFGSINISQIFTLIYQYISQEIINKSIEIKLKHFINKSLLVGNTNIKSLGNHEVFIKLSADFIAKVVVVIENEGVKEEEISKPNESEPVEALENNQPLDE